MMFPRPVQNLIDQLVKLPDVGPRAASRLVFYFLRQPQSELKELAQSIVRLKSSLYLCANCFNITENKNQPCHFCRDPQRDKSVVCVVADVLNIAPIERTKQYGGLYYVLGGVISPQNGVGPDDLHIASLVKRLRQPNQLVREIVFGLSPTVEGDTTTLYLERLIKPLNIKTTRLARGLSTGSDLQYVDEHTLTSAFRDRK